MIEKRRIREFMLRKRDMVYNPSDHKRICDKLIEVVEDNRVNRMHVFLSMSDEINILSSIQSSLDKGIEVYASVSLKGGILNHRRLESLDKVEPGIFGTRQPIGSDIDLPQMDLIVVPGLAYDINGYRIGYGGGYYDRFLATQESALFVAPCYEFQIIDDIPKECFDIPVHGFAMPDRYLAVAK